MKPLPMRVRYAFLGNDESDPVIISSHLTIDQEEKLLSVLNLCKEVIDWRIKDLKCINPLIYTHHSFLEEGSETVR